MSGNAVAILALILSGCLCWGAAIHAAVRGAHPLHVLVYLTGMGGLAWAAVHLGLITVTPL